MAGHSDLNIKTCGLFVDQTAPYLGASPDALVHCTCCGNGVVEVKCPWSAQDCVSLEEAAEQQKDFCLQKLANGGLQLVTVHPYFLQCQLQLHITKRAYCDFVVWHRAGLHIERITHVDQQSNLEEPCSGCAYSQNLLASGTLGAVPYCQVIVLILRQILMRKTQGPGAIARNQKEAT